MHDGQYQSLLFSETGNLVEHNIEDQRPVGRFQEVVWEPHFELLPKQFDNAGLLENTNRKQQVGDQAVLAFQGDTNQWHLAGGLLPLAKRLEADRSWAHDASIRQAEALSFVWVHESRAIVMAFQDGELLLINSYPVANNAEVLYFSLAPYHVEKIHPSKVRVLVWADESRLLAILNEYNRMSIAAFSAPLSPVYGPNKRVPFAHFLAPLMELAACELPEGN